VDFFDQVCGKVGNIEYERKELVTWSSDPLRGYLRLFPLIKMKGRCFAWRDTQHPDIAAGPAPWISEVHTYYRAPSFALGSARASPCAVGLPLSGTSIRAAAAILKTSKYSVQLIPDVGQDLTDTAGNK